MNKPVGMQTAIVTDHLFVEWMNEWESRNRMTIISDSFISTFFIKCLPTN